MRPERERELITAAGRAMLPAGSKLPCFDETSADRVIAYLAKEAPLARTAFRGFLHSLDATCRLRYRRGLAAATDAQRLNVMRLLYEQSAATRLLCKLGFAPLKTLHLDDPRVYRSVGCQYRAAPVKREVDRRTAGQIFNAESLEGLQQLETDVVVVGSGAGGAVVAAELARRGHDVVILEAGAHFDRSDFTTLSRPEMTQRAYRSLVETTALGNTVIPILVGSSVGGSTTVNSGTCFRTPDDVLMDWAGERRLPGLHPRAMARHFERVESVLQVAPATHETLGGSAHVIARGCDTLGYAHGPLQRNAPACDGQGVCVFGCPTDAKRSTNVSYIPLALRSGALLVTGAEVERVLTAHGAAYGVAATLRTAAGEARTLTVRARRVVLACGALYTPTLMMKSGLGVQNPHLGRHLSVHPATSAYARMPHEVNGHRGIPQGYAIEEFRHEGVMFEGAFTPLEFLALDLPFLGAPLVEALEAYRHLAAFGIMVKDRGNGRVTLSRSGGPQLWYRLGRHEVAILKRAMRLLTEVFLAAGAEAVYLPLRQQPVVRSAAEVAQLTSRRLRARDFELTAYHPLGTARMARCASEGVVDTNHEVYGIHRLHVVDASSVPSSLGVNPQVTIMAMATRAAERIDDQLTRSAT
jgi:choline dehydrogenase-like flavoprotein